MSAVAVETKSQRIARKRAAAAGGSSCAFPHGPSFTCVGCAPKPERPTLDAEGEQSLREEYTEARGTFLSRNARATKAEERATAMRGSADEAFELARRLERRCWKYQLDVDATPMPSARRS